MSDHDRLGRAWQLITAMVLRLVSAGWNFEVSPGEEIILPRGGRELRPCSELNAIVNGRGSIDDWRNRCAALGIGELPLFGAVAAV